MKDTQCEMNYYHLTNFDDRVILVVFLSFLESHKKHNKKVNRSKYNSNIILKRILPCKKDIYRYNEKYTKHILFNFLLSHDWKKLK